MPGKKKPSSPASMPSPLEVEKVFSDLTRLLSDKEFTSEEEMNAYLAELSAGGALPAPHETTDADRAWTLLDQAQEARNPKRRAALVRQAIALDPDSADAYLFLAQEAPTRAEAMSHLLEAVQAGERALPRSIESLAADGAVWFAHESRPYMRARAALATELWWIGDRQPAIDAMWDLLRLNPNDNQGLRYIQLGWLLSAGSLAAIERLVALFPDDGTAAWRYDRALHAFRTTGDSAASRKLLESALRQNPHVPAFLLGAEPFPDALPDYVGFGDESEAAAYAADAIHRWSEDAESLDWLMAKVGKRLKGR